MRFLSKRRRPFGPKLCEVCEAQLGIQSTPLLSSDYTRDIIRLHETWTALLSSARKGCELCRLFRYTWLASNGFNDHPSPASGPILLRNELYYHPGELRLQLDRVALRNFRNGDWRLYPDQGMRRTTNIELWPADHDKESHLQLNLPHSHSHR
jgi:hypothetical protein